MGPEPMSRIFFKSVRRGICCGPWSGGGERATPVPSYHCTICLQGRGPGRAWARPEYGGRILMLRTLSLAALLGLLAGPARAGDPQTYTIKLKKAGEGSVSRVDKSESG